MIYSVEPFLTILKYTNHKIQPNYYVAAAGPGQVHARVRWIHSDIEREELHLMSKNKAKAGRNSQLSRDVDHADECSNGWC